ncbi:MAG: hypothetical protein ABTQ29_09460 [Siculibacillus sp.]
MITRRLLLLVSLALLAVGSGPRLARAEAPPRGSALRKAILDALRGRVEQDLGAPVEFEVSRINVDREWAFVSATPVRPGGAPIDWTRTRFAEEIAKDMMSTVLLALLRHDGTEWRIAEYDLGPTDVTWVEWIAKYGLTERFFLE